MVGLRQYQWGRTVGSVSYLSGHRSHPERQVSVSLNISFYLVTSMWVLALKNRLLFCLSYLDISRSGEPTCGRHSLQRPKAEASSHVSIMMTCSLDFCNISSRINVHHVDILPQEAVCVYIGGALPPDLLTDPVFSLSPEHGYVSCGTTVIHGLFHSRFR